MAAMRVISGVAKGRKLRLVPGDKTRPISDRVKEALFNIIGEEIVGAKFLDLFAGTGSVGIEALSRGAEYVRLIDNNNLAIQTIQENMAMTNLNTGAEVLRVDAFAHLAQKNNLSFDYIYIAPPQYKQLWTRALNAIKNNPDWLVEDGWVIVQIDPREYEERQFENILEFDKRKYGNTELIFFEKEPVTNE